MNNPRIVVTGTDTDIGKTVFSAALAGAIGACYWKPVQVGRDDRGRSDSDRVLALSGLSASHILPAAYDLATPASPHLAAEIDGIAINPECLEFPEHAGPLVIEGAGGALVPLTREFLYADLFARWGLPTVIVARTALGTINHSLLTVEALRARGVPMVGIAFVGDANEDSEATICAMGCVQRLGRLPTVNPLDAPTLAAAFAEHFNPEDFFA